MTAASPVLLISSAGLCTSAILTISTMCLGWDGYNRRPNSILSGWVRVKLGLGLGHRRRRTGPKRVRESALSARLSPSTQQNPWHWHKQDDYHELKIARHTFAGKADSLAGMHTVQGIEGSLSAMRNALLVDKLYCSEVARTAKKSTLPAVQASDTSSCQSSRGR